MVDMFESSHNLFRLVGSSRNAASCQPSHIVLCGNGTGGKHGGLDVVSWPGSVAWCSGDKANRMAPWGTGWNRKRRQLYYFRRQRGLTPASIDAFPTWTIRVGFLGSLASRLLIRSCLGCRRAWARYLVMAFAGALTRLATNPQGASRSCTPHA